MKLKVKVQDHIFDVEVGDLNERPIIANVEGEVFEVWPERKAAYTATTTSRAAKPVSEGILASPPLVPKTGQPDLSASSSVSKSRLVRAPIPGVITAISIQAGDLVEVGQELCKLEAMKMNNSVRSSHAGRINSIRVSVGQQVKHSDVLMEFAEE